MADAVATTKMVGELPVDKRGVGMFRNCHRSIELREAAGKGRGLFATEFIPKGTVVWEDCTTGTEAGFASREVPIEEVETKWTDPKQIEFCQHYAYQVNDGFLSAPQDEEALMQDASNFWNHSCDPSTWMINNSRMEARRDIAAGEEITADYGTWLACDFLANSFERCCCNAECCRGRVTKEDWKRPDLQERYGDHWAEFILEKIRALNSSSS